MTPPTSSKRSKYTGSKRRLVLAFDIGTTYSGISYCILDPGQTPEIKGVTRFPAHEQVNGASKIPTTLWYRHDGTMAAAGAEASQDSMLETASDEGWEKAHWFKMHVRSHRATTLDMAERLPPLPSGKTVIDVLGDFMKYLLQCAKSYIEDAHANGREVWTSIESSINYIVSHPNGWEGFQQAQMLDAAIQAGLIADSERGRSKVTFVTEGEASLHYAIHHGLPDGVLNDSQGVIIVDAGGGTVDISAYRRRVTNGDFEEIAAPQCYFHGSVFVTLHAKLFLTHRLRDSDFADDIDHIAERFDVTTKLHFRTALEPQYIRFGGTKDKDPSCGIRFGQLKIPGEDVAGFFAPSVKCVVDGVLDQVGKAHNAISHVILVGGFASSEWLYDQVRRELRDKGLIVVRPESHTAKAVSDGAVSFYLRRRVRSRVSKYAYGALHSVTYDSANSEHAHRQQNIYLSAAGRQRIRGSFKNCKIDEKREYRSASTYRFSSLGTMKTVRASVWCYKGDNPKPQWLDSEPGMYSKLCEIVMDMSRVPYKTMRKEDGQRGKYYEIDYDYVLYYHGVELKAQMAWCENGVEKRPAKVVYDPTD